MLGVSDVGEPPTSVQRMLENSLTTSYVLSDQTPAGHYLPEGVPSLWIFGNP